MKVRAIEVKPCNKSNFRSNQKIVQSKIRAVKNRAVAGLTVEHIIFLFLIERKDKLEWTIFG